MESNFRLFGPAHLAILASVPALAAILTFIQRKYLREFRWLRVAMGAVLLLDTVLWYVNLARHGLLTFPERMPLELCDATLFLTIVVLFSQRSAIFDIAYYTALAGGSMALLTPNLWEPFPSLSTLQFFIAHGLTVASVLYLVWSGRARPRPGSLVRTMLAVNLYAVFVGAFDFFFKTNFMYLRQKPARASLLDMLGPWPWYIASAEAVAFCLFFLLYLPFRRSARKQSAVMLLFFGVAALGASVRAQEPHPAGSSSGEQQAAAVAAFQAGFPAYRVRLIDKTELGPVPALEIYRNEQLIFRLPLVSGLDSASAREHLSSIHYQVHEAATDKAGLRFEIVASAQSSVWTAREFHWRFYADHLEFDQTARGAGQVGRCYFFSNGVSGRWDKGSSDGGAWNSVVMADRYWSPSPNHASQWEFSIAAPQTLGFGSGAHEGSDEDFRPERMIGIFSPPPLMLAFHRGGEWASVGIGAQPGQYRFPALEYSGSRYAGASWWVDYLGYQTVGNAQKGEFHSPVAAIHFAYSALDALEHYSAWLRQSGFATSPSFPDVAWHHLPVFCGWAEQTISSIPYGRAPNAESTQKNYEDWIAELDRRNLPIGTIVIDDKWQKGYGSFDIDPAKWPDLKGFVAAQHARGRHVLLWVPVGHTDGLPDALCIHDEHGKCLAPDLGNPAYEKFLRVQIRFLIETVGVDGFKEDWVWAPSAAGLPVPPELAGIEAVRRFQQILYSETHRWKPDAMIETQTANAAFRDSSDVLRLNDIWYATRDVVGTMRERARIAHIAGWELVDTDNASSTTLETWWQYMEAQPSIGIPALYFVHRTESTMEEPPETDWVALAGIWRRYIAGLAAAPDSAPNP